jgi:hypothetical protein
MSRNAINMFRDWVEMRREAMLDTVLANLRELLKVQPRSAGGAFLSGEYKDQGRADRDQRAGGYQRSLHLLWLRWRRDNGEWPVFTTKRIEEKGRRRRPAWPTCEKAFLSPICATHLQSPKYAAQILPLIAHRKAEQRTEAVRRLDHHISKPRQLC